MPRHCSVNEMIDNAVNALSPGTTFESAALAKQVFEGRWAVSGRKVSAIMKARIRCDENPKGDLRYEPKSRTWLKLVAVNA